MMYSLRHYYMVIPYPRVRNKQGRGVLSHHVFTPSTRVSSLSRVGGIHLTFTAIITSPYPPPPTHTHTPPPPPSQPPHMHTHTHTHVHTHTHTHTHTTTAAATTTTPSPPPPLLPHSNDF